MYPLFGLYRCMSKLVYLDRCEPATQQVSSDVSVDYSRMQGACRHTSTRYTLSQFPSKHDIGQLAPVVGLLRIIAVEKIMQAGKNC